MVHITMKQHVQTYISSVIHGPSYGTWLYNEKMDESEINYYNNGTLLTCFSFSRFWISFISDFNSFYFCLFLANIYPTKTIIGKLENALVDSFNISKYNKDDMISQIGYAALPMPHIIYGISYIYRIWYTGFLRYLCYRR